MSGCRSMQGAGGSPPAPSRALSRLLTLPIAVAAAVAVGVAPAPAAASDWADATPTAWHQLARAESLLSAPEPPNPVAVCIVDSGVNITPDLEGVVIERLAYDGGDPGDTYPQDGIDDGHGTYVATFLAGQVNGWGGAGLWPRAKIVSVRVFPPGARRTTAAAYLKGLRSCMQRGVEVINLSLGDLVASEEEVREIEQRLSEYRREGVNVVAAAGNRGGDVEVPARFPAAFAVAAESSTNTLCPFSARGAAVDIAAPGCGLHGADQQGQWASFDGTSFAAPMVSAALAALRGYSNMSADEAEDRILSYARRGNAGKALDVDAALAPGSFDWRMRPPEPIRAESTPLSASATNDDFVEYPRPRFRLRRAARSGWRIVQITNCPPNAAIETRFRSRAAERSCRPFRVPRIARTSIRFISNVGASVWVRVGRSKQRAPSLLS